MPCCIQIISLWEQRCLISYFLFMSSLQKVAFLLTHARQEHVLTLGETHKCCTRKSLPSPCGNQKRLHKLLCNTAASQPARQSAVLVWGERSYTSAKSARWTINWPHVTTAPLSSICFWAFPDLPCFPIPLSHFLSCQLSDEKGLCIGCWLKQQEFMWCVNSLWGLWPLSDRFVYFSCTFQLLWLFACPFQCLLLVWGDYLNPPRE